ncbi:hypothetical protein HMPREF0293_0489 [Corynebacterium glucuronolyticum ATCC 51866]|uniref:Uncharacterized protein n=1 Tax=Corynebacterium glucuronolyticum ATCC 51866 TaxID=548478 RepID=A0ABP2DXH0_9CORY|nr:hypothetical protein HMPREF0293_0489 [Corynebacterium glucuronolyticum ATCC 51866]
MDWMDELRRGNTSACAEKRRIYLLDAVDARKYLRMRGEEHFRGLGVRAPKEIPPHARRRA